MKMEFKKGIGGLKKKIARLKLRGKFRFFLYQLILDYEMNVLKSAGEARRNQSDGDPKGRRNELKKNQ